MSTDEVALQRYLEMDEEELLEGLADSLVGSGPGFGPEDVERRIRFAQAWLDERRDDLKQQVCGQVWVSLERGGGFDRLADAAAVADSLQALLGKPTAFIAAAILIRRGLRGLCGES